MRTGAIGLAAAALLMASPALADVKAGVDAWSRGEYDKAIAEWRGPAISGDADAQFNLGQAYKLGRGVPADAAQAEGWFRKAAQQGHLQAEDNYGLSLFQGNKRGEAVPWLEKSVARGEPRTQLVLGTMLFNGDGVAKDWVRAYALMTRASASGLAAAGQTLAQMDQYIPAEDRQKGLTLARQYEAQAARAPLPGGPSGRTVAPGSTRPTGTRADTRPTTIRPADLPPSRVAEPRPAPVTGNPAPPRVATITDRPAPPRIDPAPRPTASGRYRIQLGAFRDEGNARALWTRIGARVGGEASYPRAGALVRLQAGPYPGRAQANRACAAARAAGSQCVVVAP